MKRRRSILLALATAVTTIAVVESPMPAPVQASAADGCLPTNGLMNLNNADQLLAGSVRISSSMTVQIGSGNANWNHPTLNTEQARLLYSMKWVEELIREHRKTGNAQYLNRAVALVLDFAADNPVGGGPDPVDAWDPMYAGQRTTAIACVAAVSNNAAVDTVFRTHASWLTTQVDGIPPWNQAIDPHLGLLMAGCRFDVAAWRTQASNGFVRLIRAMIDVDGVLTEQAPGYGQFVWERWGTVEQQLSDCGLAAPSEIPQRRTALLEWLAWMSAPDGTVTPIGDSFRVTQPPTPAGSPTAYTVPGGTTGTPPTGEIKVFPGGYVAGRSSWSNLASTTYWTLRFGPGRDLHGHEDHTAVTFWVDGHEVLIDSGHSGYTDAAFRLALRAPESHNVLVLPGVDFRQNRATELVRSQSGAGWRFDEVSNEGVYTAQGGDAVHANRTRGVLVFPDDGIMVVQDRASRSGSGLFEQLWHLVPGATVVSTDRDGVVARHPSGAVDVHVRQVPLPGQTVPTSSTSVVEGQTSPTTLGWFAESNGHREPAPVVRMRRDGTMARMVTVITTTPVGADVTASASIGSSGWTIDLDVDGDAKTVGISFDGAMRSGAPTDSQPPSVAAGTRRCFPVTGDPGDAAIVNLTPVEAQGAGNGLLLGSDVGDPPVAANVNYSAGSVDPNVAVVPIGTDGQVCFQNAWRRDVHLVADHLGTIDTTTYTPATTSGAPQRVTDTRDSGGIIPPNGRRCFAVTGNPGDAAIVNLTPVNAAGNGNGLLVSSDVTTPPLAANVNYSAGSVDPNVAVVPIGTDGQVCYINARLTSVHLVADHLGTIDTTTYTPATTSGAPQRVTDTRDSGGIIPPNGRRCFAVTGNPGDAAIVNLTPVNAAGNGNGLLVSSDVTTPPLAANVNYSAGSVDPNVAVVPIGTDGQVCYINARLTSVHLVADHLGTIDTTTYTPATTSGAPQRVTDTRD